MAVSENIELDTGLFGKKTVILGKSGSGKSYTARVLIEEGRELGVPFIVIDPQNAYGNLPDFDYVMAKDIKEADEFGKIVAMTNPNVVIRMNGLTPAEQNIWVNAFLQQYLKHQQKGIHTLVMDEAHKFAPEIKGTESKDIVLGMNQENRSDGLGLITIEQRPARLSKTVISQADIIFIHKLTSYADLNAIKGYLDEPDKELKIVKGLQTGQAYIVGINEQGDVHKIRKSKSEHTGDSPKVLLTSQSNIFKESISKLKKRGAKMAENVSTANEPVNKVIPSIGGFMDLAQMGMKMSVGAASAGVVGNLVGRYAPSLPFVSGRTVGAGATTVAMYALYRNVGNAAVKDFLKYGTAGSAAYTLGSVAWDVVSAMNINVPPMVGNVMMMATGAGPVVVEGNKAIKTQFA